MTLAFVTTLALTAGSVTRRGTILSVIVSLALAVEMIVIRTRLPRELQHAFLAVILASSKRCARPRGVPGVAANQARPEHRADGSPVLRPIRVRLSDWLSIAYRLEIV